MSELYLGKYRVESTRLKGFDYDSAGAYFITVCSKDRDLLFGTIGNGIMQVSDYGKIVQECWFDLPNHYSNLILDAFVIMPDHVHGIIIIVETGHPIVETGHPIVETGLRPVSTSITTEQPAITTIKKRYGLSEFVRAFKSFSARRINEKRGTPGKVVWQSRFYDEILRDDENVQRVREYIDQNPRYW